MRKTVIGLLLFITFSVFLVGCEQQALEKPELMRKMVVNATEMTQKAIDTKDIKLAREIWSKISEYGIKAREQGKTELAEALGKWASTYVYLINYLESNDTFELEKFKLHSQESVNKLMDIISQN